MAERKTTRTSTRKTVKSTPTEDVTTQPESYNLVTGRKFPKFTKLQIGILVALLLAGVVYLLRGWFVIAFVNGQPITRLQLINDLESQYGKQAENNLVTKTLILQEAKKKGVNVSAAEVNDEIKKIELQLSQGGQSLDQALAAQGMTRSSLDEQIRLQKIIEKLVGKDTQVTDAEVSNYIEQNKASIPEGSDTNELRTAIRQQLLQQKQSDKVQTLLKQLQDKAKIFYIVQY